ncbi:hypothetical protein GCM10010145_66570 [Streptomyces ruber]|uniref:Fungal lipase-like domain-containing protein n=2 Tax=Streptomyces TaxID=1883 RepID=A0A918F081_9ACTN|nr:hypothetical protein GCM10010145_66570 [Streptomyces ruber]
MLYAFGRPMVGDRAFADRFQALVGALTFRHVYQYGLVPRLPPRTAGDSTDFGTESFGTRTGPWSERALPVQQVLAATLSVPIGIGLPPTHTTPVCRACVCRPLGPTVAALGARKPLDAGAGSLRGFGGRPESSPAVVDVLFGFSYGADGGVLRRRGRGRCARVRGGATEGRAGTACAVPPAALVEDRRAGDQDAGDDCGRCQSDSRVLIGHCGEVLRACTGRVAPGRAGWRREGRCPWRAGPPAVGGTARPRVRAVPVPG